MANRENRTGLGRRAFLALLLAGALGACQGEPRDVTPAAAAYEAFGEAFEPVDAVPVRAVVAEPARFVGQAVKVEGTVREVCRMKGCWLTLDAGDGRYVRVSVPREDDGYVFTVPTDIDGRRVVVSGLLEEAVLTADEQRHLAEDAARAAGAEDAGSPADAAPAPDETKEFRLTASGVLVQKART